MTRVVAFLSPATTLEWSCVVVLSSLLKVLGNSPEVKARLLLEVCTGSRDLWIIRGDMGQGSLSLLDTYFPNQSERLHVYEAVAYECQVCCETIFPKGLCDWNQINPAFKTLCKAHPESQILPNDCKPTNLNASNCVTLCVMQVCNW